MGGLIVTEFTAVLNEDNLFDIFIDGERCYFDFDSQDLKEFADDFIESNKWLTTSNAVQSITTT